MNEFVLVTREEIWTGGPKKTLLEERLSHGVAHETDRGFSATDARDEELVTLAAERIDAAHTLLTSLSGARVRIVVSVRRAGAMIRTGVTMSIRIGSHSAIATPQTAAADYERVARAAASKVKGESGYRGVPLIWRGGSGSVLLHEAAGHAAEAGAHRSARWPSWLSIHDEPEIQIDDTGHRCASANLLSGEPPSAWRRASFSDLPLRRMSNVIVRQQGAPFDLPQRRIEIDLIAGGHYDALKDLVTIDVSSAELIDGRMRRNIAPFRISETRHDVARAIIGAEGEPLRYPGVICSSEGQELVVGSHAPLLATVFDA